MQPLPTMSSDRCQQMPGKRRNSGMNDEEDRKARLAQALRHNLRRRKAQARGEGAASPVAYEGDAGGGSSDTIPETR